MKQMVIISGKGGTGKTTVAASFASLAVGAVLADADVDAANLHLILDPAIKVNETFSSGQEAIIDEEICTRCGECRSLCRFDAISEDFRIDSQACEGCGLCARRCPVEAIHMKPCISGRWFISDTRFGPFVHARLGIAADNSGKLVALVREKARELGEQRQSDFLIIDGAPGVGCPVIASVTGCDLALAVTEPTRSGLHDLKRVIELTQHFRVPTLVAINKADLDEEMSDQIEEFCREKHLMLAGRIPFDPSVVKAMVAGETLVDYSAGAAAQALRRLWEVVSGELAGLEAAS